VAKSPELYDADTLGRIRSGESISDEAYHAALGKLEVIRREVAAKFQGVDALLTPTTPIPAPRRSAMMKDPAGLRPTELMLLRNTRPVNVWGVPAISVPCGWSADGLPIGLQIIGPPQGEKTVLSIASLLERHANPSSE